jgi:hypothetical protein
MAASALMGGMDFTALADFVRLHSGELSAVFSQIAWVTVLYLLVNAFLSGGILDGLRGNNTHSPIADFFSGCGKYVGRFLRLFLFFCIVLVIVVPVLTFTLAMLSELFTKDSASEITDFVFAIIEIVLFLVPVTILLMIADYTKIAVVVNDETSMLKTAWASTKFVFRYFFKTFGLELLMLLAPIALLAIYVLLDLIIGMTTDLTIIVMLILQQLFMVTRAWTKVFFFAGELAMYQSLQPVVYSTVEGVDAPIVTEPLKP